MNKSPNKQRDMNSFLSCFVLFFRISTVLPPKLESHRRVDQGQEHSGSFFRLAFGAESPVLLCKAVCLPTDMALEQEQEE